MTRCRRQSRSDVHGRDRPTHGNQNIQINTYDDLQINSAHKVHISQIIHTVNNSQTRFVDETESSVFKKPDRQNVENQQGNKH